jgi:outer membrane receptor protein involved in Fe transport
MTSSAVWSPKKTGTLRILKNVSVAGFLLVPALGARAAVAQDNNSGSAPAGASSSAAVAAPSGALTALASSTTAAASASAGTATAGATETLPEYTIVAASEAVWASNTKLDDARDKNLLPKLGASAYAIDQTALRALPQGDNTPLDKVLLQAPGVSYDSAISNPDFHVRNEYANIQYRINGIQLPDGVSALGPVLETGFIGKLNLLDGALPAQYGLRTAGVVDITTKTEPYPGGDVDVYGGTWGTFSPSVEYGGNLGQTQYFAIARTLQSRQGLENAMPTEDPIHDATAQEKFFGYGSTLFGDSVRLTYMAGSFDGKFQIPDETGQQPLGDYGSPDLSSASLNDNETDQFYFGLAALQTHRDGVDTQWSVYARYASIAFMPDVNGDLAFDDVASQVTRNSMLSGTQFDASERLGRTDTLRAGFDFSIEQTQVDDLSTVLPLDSGGNPLPTPEAINDADDKLGWGAGVYLQDEWRLFPDLTLNTGLRFDQIEQFVSANQLSPRIALVYDSGAGTDIHAGVARYFTPPMQAQSTPNNLGLFNNTTQEQAITTDAQVEPERATYYDVGVDQKFPYGISGGVDGYYKASTDTLDDGQFGQAVVLDQFNYARGYSQGVEGKLGYEAGGFRAYANLSCELTRVEDVVSNQYAIGDPVELAYLANNYSGSSDAQAISASFGAAYRWRGVLASVDGIHGSGLPEGFANEQNTPAYTQWNAALAWSAYPWHDQKPLTLRVSVVNVFDLSYVLRGAGGVGEFAPQYGPRRGLFADLSQQF